MQTNKPIPNSRPTSAFINIDAMKHNLRIAKNHSKGKRIWAVVKADAYGHGLLRAMQGFAEADGMAMIEPEGVRLICELGWKKPTLLLEGPFCVDDLRLAGYGTEFVVHNEEQVSMVDRCHTRGLHLHIKVNTGMNRLGFRPAEVEEIFKHLSSLKNVSSVSLTTHMANADVEDEHPVVSDKAQAEMLKILADRLAAESSISNSAQILRGSRGDWVRAGIMLYGATPGPKTAAQYGLKPVMTFHSKVLAIQHLEAGEAVGYGSRVIAKVPMVIAVVACGYADGYPRIAKDGTPVLVNGERVPLVGRVSMDMLTVDVSRLVGTRDEAKVGSEVELWGANLPVDEVAASAGTIGYELLCAINKRVQFHD